MAARVVPEHTSSYKRPPYCRDVPVGQVDALMLNAIPSGVPAPLMVGDAFPLASVIWAHGAAYQGDRIAFSAGEYNEQLAAAARAHLPARRLGASKGRSAAAERQLLHLLPRRAPILGHHLPGLLLRQRL